MGILNSVALSTFADFVDRKVNVAEKPVADYLDQHTFMAQVVYSTHDSLMQQAEIIPLAGQLAGVVVHPADTVHGFVDMFRFGGGTAEGIETGSPEPIIKDVMRGVNIVALLDGARSAGVARVRLGGGARAAALLKDVPGNACAPMSLSFALRKGGLAPVIDAAEIVKVYGGTPAVIADYHLGRAGLLDVLDKLKYPYRTLANPSSMAELEKVVRAQGPSSSTIFGIKFANGDRHAMVAFIENGKFKIWDRTGSVVESLSELESEYQGISRAQPSGVDPRRPLIVIEGLSVARELGKAAVLTLKLNTMLAVARKDADVQMVAEGIEAKSQRAAGTIPEKIPSVPIIGGPIIIRKRVAPRSDWLTGVKYRLNHLGYGAGRVVHVYDNRCKAAIRAFQKDYRLTVDAIPGPQTQARLVQVCGY